MTDPASRIDRIFADLRRQGRTALMPFITAGHPSLEVTGRLIPALERAGASVVEIGIPFSDPIADGPVIAAAMHEALQRGVTPDAVLELVAAVRPRTGLGLLAMVSDSIVQRMGPAHFVAAAAAAGLDGLIVPDVDLDAAGELHELTGGHGLSFSMLVAPSTTPRRLEQITRLCRGFVYLLARSGITGERSDAPEVAERVAAVRRTCDLPIAVGFGIAAPAQVTAVTRHADAAIVGSALVRRIGDAEDPVAAAASFTGELAAALARRPGATAAPSGGAAR